MVQSQALVEDKKAILRRTILHKLMIPFKLTSSGDSRVQKGFVQGITSVRIDCTLRTFQCIVKDSQEHCM